MWGGKIIIYWNFVQAREISLLNFHCNKTGSTDFKSAVVQALFDSELGRALFKSIYVGSAIQTIPLEKLRKLEIPLPSLEEQNIIGEKYKEELGSIADLKEKLLTSREKLKRIFNIKTI